MKSSLPCLCLVLAVVPLYAAPAKMMNMTCKYKELGQRSALGICFSFINFFKFPSFKLIVSQIISDTS
jgi:hypothetical protein